MSALARLRPLPSLALVAAAILVGCAGPTPSPSPSPSAIVTPSTAPGASEPVATATPVPPTAAPQRVPPALVVAPVVDGLDAPVDLAFRPADPDTLYVVEQIGRIRAIRDGELIAAPVLDIASIVSAGGERGLLGLAFHPDPDDPRLFVYYTALDGSQVLAAYTIDGERGEADPDSEHILLAMDDPFGNHNGGSLAFGPDGRLYVGTGDGGGGGDPLDSGRRLDTLLAKVLRLDVDAFGDEGPYGVPHDNPFVERDGALPEIWHTGLRNPWRMRFDRATGDLWIGDVGQGVWEEIDRAPAGVGGLDFGWNLMEGFACYRGSGECATPDLTLPVAVYGHDQGCSVTGGSVYRGPAIADLTGWYVFSDYCSGTLWAIDADAPDPTARQEPIVVGETDTNISAIAEDARGELYAADLNGRVLGIGVNPSGT